MILDTSAIVAIIMQESTAAAVSRVLGETDRVLMSSSTWVELGVVEDRWMTEEQRERTHHVLDEVGVHFVPLSVSQARIARMAHRRHGPGSGSPARLNMGDCFSYALAIDLDEPLLFVGDNFVHTDVRRVRLS